MNPLNDAAARQDVVSVGGVSCLITLGPRTVSGRASSRADEAAASLARGVRRTANQGDLAQTIQRLFAGRLHTAAQLSSLQDLCITIVSKR
jgi:hypothetical protein